MNTSEHSEMYIANDSDFILFLFFTNSSALRHESISIPPLLIHVKIEICISSTLNTTNHTFVVSPAKHRALSPEAIPD